MTHIEMSDDYTQTTKYSGVLNDKSSFTVLCEYDSITEHFKVSEVTWTSLTPTPNTEKHIKGAEERIKDFVQKWLFKRPKKEKDDVN
jgi:hypothetical protein